MVGRWWCSLVVILGLGLGSSMSVGAQPEPVSLPEGIGFAQQWVSLEGESLPITMVTLDLSQVRMRPLWSDVDRLVGLQVLTDMVQQQGAVAGINGGFFNRNTRQPIGAIRRHGDWISSPTLGRGAVAWTDQGDVLFERLRWRGQIQTYSGVKVSLVGINTALIRAGLSQYTPAWGDDYVTLTDDEVVIEVSQDRIQALYPTTGAGERRFPIPSQGYLLVGRETQGQVDGYQLPIGESIQIQVNPMPESFAAYPQILGAGPLLIREGEIVLDGELERFQPAFRSQRAARSAIGRLGDGRILLLTVGRSQEAAGISLNALAQLMQELGCRDGLNLDGGTSSTLAIGDQLVNLEADRIRPRIHNGIGVFQTGQLQP